MKRVPPTHRGKGAEKVKAGATRRFPCPDPTRPVPTRAKRVQAPSRGTRGNGAAPRHAGRGTAGRGGPGGPDGQGQERAGPWTVGSKGRGLGRQNKGPSL